jgi:hypothetical protein
MIAKFGLILKASGNEKKLIEFNKKLDDVIQKYSTQRIVDEI